MATITLTKDDILARQAYKDFMRIVDSDLLSASHYNHLVRYGQNFDTRRLYSKVVEMVEIQSDLDAGLL